MDSRRIFSRLAGWILLVAALSAGRAGAGQQDGESENIVVIGDADVSLSPFLERHAVASRTGQLTRWHEPICVRSWGLPLELNATLSLRVMNVAERAGAAANRSELCRPNVRIGFTTDPQRMIDEVSRHYPIVLGFHYASQRRRLTRMRFPVQAWYATASGDPLGTPMLDQAGVRSAGGVAGSRLSAGVSSSFVHVLILVDAEVAAGLEVESMADLLTMLALAHTTLAPGCTGEETVLNMMNLDCPADRRSATLTRDDIAFLRALYAVDSRLAPQSQRAAIAVHMRRALARE